MRSDILAWLSVILCILIFCGPALAVDYSDRALFSAVAPDAMIVLDLSGSMRWNPKGEYDSSRNPSGVSATIPARAIPSTTPPGRASPPIAPGTSSRSGRSTRSSMTTRTA